MIRTSVYVLGMPACVRDGGTGRPCQGSASGRPRGEISWPQGGALLAPSLSAPDAFHAEGDHTALHVYGMIYSESAFAPDLHFLWPGHICLTQLSIDRSIGLAIYHFIYLSFCLSIHVSVYLFIHPSTLSIHPPIHRSIHLPISLSIHLSSHLSG